MRLYKFLHNLLNAFVLIANKMGLQKKMLSAGICGNALSFSLPSSGQLTILAFSWNMSQYVVDCKYAAGAVLVLKIFKYFVDFMKPFGFICLPVEYIHSSSSN
jgi:hypothetical protein